MSNLGAINEIKVKLDNLIDTTGGYWPFSLTLPHSSTSQAGGGGKGGFWNFLLGDDSSSSSNSSDDDYNRSNEKIGDLWPKSVKSERKVILAYEDLMTAMGKYYKAYDAHLDNIEKLGYRTRFDSLEYIFKNILIKEQFKPYSRVDRASPLLLKNYLVASTSTPVSLKKNHVLQQVYYKLRGEFSSNEQTLIKDIQVVLTGIDRVQLIFRTADKQIYSRSVEHKRLNLHLSEVKAILKDIIEAVKSNVAFKDNMFFVSPQKKYEFKQMSVSKRRQRGAVDYMDFRKSKSKRNMGVAVNKKSLSKKVKSKLKSKSKSKSKSKGLMFFSNTKKAANNSSIRVSSPAAPNYNFHPDMTSDSALLFSDDIKGLSRSYTTGANVGSIKKQRSRTQNQDLETDIKFSPVPIRTADIRKELEKNKDISFAADKQIFEAALNINEMKEKLMVLDRDELEKSRVNRKLTGIKSKVYDNWDSKLPANLPKPPAPPAGAANAQAQAQAGKQQGQQTPQAGTKLPDLGELAAKAGQDKATPTDKAVIVAPPEIAKQANPANPAQLPIIKCKGRPEAECKTIPTCEFNGTKCVPKK